MNWINADEQLPEQDKPVEVACSMTTIAILNGEKWNLAPKENINAIVKYWRYPQILDIPSLSGPSEAI